MAEAVPDLFYLSFATGAAVVATFAYTQFNRPPDDSSRALERLVRFLKPADMRNRRVVWRAVIAYAAILLAIYTLICVAFTPPMLEAIGFALPTGVEKLEQSPVVPLMVSLAMVGAAPAIPPLQRIEERIRSLAHHISGIPMHLVEASGVLYNTPLELPEGKGNLLLPDADWDRLAYQREAVSRHMDDPSGYLADLVKIHAYRRWILDQGLGVVAGAVRDGIDNNDRELKLRIDRLLRTLDLIQPDDTVNPAREPLRDLSEQTRELCEDVCAMLMLRVEHGMFDLKPANGPGASPEASAARQMLAAFLDKAGKSSQSYALAGWLSLLSAFCAVVIAFFWGAFSGAFDGHDTDIATDVGLYFALTAVAIYALPIYVVLAMHSQAVAAGRKTGVADRKTGRTDRRTGKIIGWPSIATEKLALCMGPVIRLFFAAFLVALAGILVISLSKAALSEGVTPSSEYWSDVFSALYKEGPRAIFGPIVAIGIVALIDIAAAKRAALSRTPTRVIGLTLAVLIIAAPTTHALALQYDSVMNIDECPAKVAERNPEIDAEAHCDEFRYDSWGNLVARNWQELSLVGLRVLLIGGAVLFVCQATLAAGQVGRHTAPAPPAPA